MYKFLQQMLQVKGNSRLRIHKPIFFQSPAAGSVPAHPD